MAEDYAAKMSRKTDAELRDYVDNRYQYREEAVLAALDELARRGTPEPRAAALAEELRISQQDTNRREAAARELVVEQEQTRRIARGQVDPELAEATGPALYSPGTITIFSVLFSMLAGGLLLVLNLRTLRRTGPALLVVAFMIAYMVGGGYLLFWLKQLYGDQYNWLGSFFNLPAVLLYNLFFWPRYIGPQPYRSRSWLGPLLVCGLIMLAFYYFALRFKGAMPVM
ncbi:hypothetical protein [Hymenobacter glacieicola]|uniref:Uncharacterized protein n=1 Tax=Hymenobacter glacieicola TaxID=1562124 RepID=A0ABQ1WSY2_9BACT|nr:hypothetical protein [Hymenobacter glacieicola]GGG44468.1 hypothetical protein GCM10011378_21010 [Hymenobacter glacieicola]